MEPLEIVFYGVLVLAAASIIAGAWVLWRRR